MSNRVVLLRTFSKFCGSICHVNKHATRTIVSLSSHRRPLLPLKFNLTDLNRHGFKNFDYDNRRLHNFEKYGLYACLFLTIYLFFNPILYTRLFKLKRELRKRRQAMIENGADDSKNEDRWKSGLELEKIMSVLR